MPGAKKSGAAWNEYTNSASGACRRRKRMFATEKPGRPEVWVSRWRTVTVAAVSGIAAARRASEEFRQQRANRLVQGKPAALHALHDRRGRHRLGDRGQREDRSGIYRPVGMRIGRADIARAGHLSRAERPAPQPPGTTASPTQLSSKPNARPQRVRVHARRFSPRHVNTHCNSILAINSWR